MSRYLMGIVGAIALFGLAISEASAQFVEGLNDLLFGPLRPRNETIALEEAGRLVQRQSPAAIPSQGTNAQVNAVPGGAQNQPTIVPDQPATVQPTNPQPVTPAVPAGPDTGEAPDSIPALW